jgi:hypothetical protein
VAQASEAITINAGYEWGQSSGSYLIGLGSTSNKTCFLSGIRAKLEPPPCNHGDCPPAAAGVYMDAGSWVFERTSNANLSVKAQCVASTAGRTSTASWISGAPATLIAPVTAARRCFLTYITDYHGLNSNSDYVRVWSDDFNWYVGGNSVGNGTTTARAICIDAPGAGHWQWIAGDPGGFTANLAYNDENEACFLRGLGGHFTSTNWGDGVWTNYNQGTLFWEATVNNGKTGWYGCIK